MHIEVKKISLVRFIGASLILISLFSSIFLDFFLLDNWLLFSFNILIVVPWILFSFFLKLEINFFKQNIIKVLLILIGLSLIFTVIGLILSADLIMGILFFTLSISTLLITICWHFSISIYKREKLFAILACIGYSCVSLFVRISLLIPRFGPITSVTPLFLLLLGFLLIISIELYMKRKGLLKYI